MKEISLPDSLREFDPDRFLGKKSPKKSLKRLWIWGIALTVIAIFLWGGSVGYHLGRDRAITEDFSAYEAKHCYPEGAEFGPWLSRFNSFGCNEVRVDAGLPYLHLTPRPATEPKQTKASLVTGPAYRNDLVFQADLRTTGQLRTGSDPNPWEVGWIIWNYTDNEHFYYFIPKPEGWELGKRDPAYKGGQRFLATGLGEEAAKFPIGAWHRIRVRQQGNRIQVSVNYQTLTTFTDHERPYHRGKIGFYSEDADAWFGNVWATGTPDSLMGSVFDWLFPRSNPSL